MLLGMSFDSSSTAMSTTTGALGSYKNILGESNSSIANSNNNGGDYFETAIRYDYNTETQGWTSKSNVLVKFGDQEKRKGIKIMRSVTELDNKGLTWEGTAKFLDQAMLSTIVTGGERSFRSVYFGEALSQIVAENYAIGFNKLSPVPIKFQSVHILELASRKGGTICIVEVPETSVPHSAFLLK